MELRRLWEIICRRKWTIFQAFTIIFLVASVGSFLVKKIKPTYRATARLFVSGTTGVETSLLEGINLQGLDQLTSTKSVSDNPIDTQIALITSWPIVDKVIKKLQLKDKRGRWLKAKDLTKSRFLPPIFPVRRLIVEQYEETDILEVSGESDNKAEAAELANTLTNVYINEAKKLSREELTELYKFANKEIDGVEKKYTNALRQLKEFKKKEKTIDLDKEVSTLIEKMAELMKDQESHTIDIYEAKVKLKTTRAQLKKEVETMVSAGVVSASPQIETLKKGLAEEETNLAGLLVEFTNEHPDVIKTKKKMEKIKEELSQELKIHQEMAPELNTLEKEIAVLGVHLKKTDSLIKKYSQRLLTLPRKEYQLAQLQLRVSTAKDIYSSLLKYRDEITLASALQLCNVRLVAPAETQEKPARPKMVFCTVAGAFLGLITGLGLGFLSEYIDDTIKDTDDVKKYLKISPLGTIPLTSKKEILLSKKGESFYLTDAYRRIAHNIKMVTDGEIKHLLITSAGPGEGKTITAANLGITIAQNKRKVLLVDVNFLKPETASLFNLSQKPGLNEVLSGKVQIDEAIQATDVEGLSVLSCGEYPFNFGQFLESAKMKELINKLEERFDAIIYDTAAVLAASDTVVLASCLRNTLIVLQAGKLSRKKIAHAREMLKNSKAKILGVVLNKSQKSGY